MVRDSVYVDDELVEDTYDWFAQDRDGNVWYLGEDSQEIDDGEVVSTEGSWEAGVDGALPGIVMPAEPAVGDAYRQEYYVGEAEDMFEIIAVGGSVDGPRRQLRGRGHDAGLDAAGTGGGRREAVRTGDRQAARGEDRRRRRRQ